ncbi:transcription termination/antitermination NusG family protein [Rhizobium leguminosarum]|uniref:transcription termination/antitermination NusG family protein n=1 Tax=Rhizobium leguminosarum TaxID=384 RepID=UPI001C96CD30|nr:transcription termination/antitermination NusG family protein [Rhizobium leguminosarum]MBY5788687.1 hypothetical protein [Rhizobium leguminosarum]
MNFIQRERLKQERVDARQYQIPAVVKGWSAESWFAIRTTPGAQRSPSIIDRTVDHRKDERDISLLERNLHRKGVEVFMPCIRREVIHHRTKKWIDKRFPVLVGYAFVNLPKRNFAEVEAIEGVAGILRPGNNPFEAPLRFPEGLIGKLRFLQFEEEQAFLLGRARRIRRQELWQETYDRPPSRAEMKSLFQRGASLHLRPGSPFSQYAAKVVSVTSKGTILASIEALDKLVQVNVTLAQIADVE